MDAAVTGEQSQFINQHVCLSTVELDNRAITCNTHIHNVRTGHSICDMDVIKLLEKC